MLTQIFMYHRPHGYQEQQELLGKQQEIVESMPAVMAEGNEAVLRALNEYGSIAQLGTDFHFPEQCTALHQMLVDGGYEIDPQLGEYFDSGDADQIAVYLVGQAMEDLKEGNPPPGIFVTRSSMALNGVEPARWQMVINREILMM